MSRTDRTTPTAAVTVGPELRPHTSHARTPAWAGLRFAILAGLVGVAAIAGGCVKTVRTPLKQALPSVLGPEASAQLCYGNPTVVDIGGAAVAGTVADVDGDGRADLALMVSGAGGHAVTFAMNDGNGGLRLTTGLKFPMNPTAIEAADLDGNGLLDLAIAATPAVDSRDDAAIHVLLGRGQGQFIAGAVATHVRPVGLWIADFTSDGASDLLVLADHGGEVELLVGDGRGEFKQGPRSRLRGPVRPEALTVGDFDLDTRLDIATLIDRGGKAEAVVEVSSGDGKGGFKPAARRVVGRHGRALVAADFNADGAADLAALADSASDGASSPIAAMLLGDAKLGFRAISYFGPDLVGDAVVTDLDRNGAPDLLVSSQRGDAVRALLGDGAGGFGPVINVPVGAVGHLARASDLDGDGRPELISFGPQAPGVAISRPQPCRK
ncbi:VCBS repeat-containing protein [Nannocystis sp.]|uniref:FG-GAP repeat domain-containing protein n=1 Tax=Nannocystis sp. TaxID=1962667 RepID=UPI0025D616F5|nr:VCBS repeat-containing protein [Nannocystis sp.]MBK7828700.1 VCBS repeat-containing protein [Nannocystis sp.]